MTKQDRREFAAYCQQCTDTQLRNVYASEAQAHRRAYAAIAKSELEKRGLT